MRRVAAVADAGRAGSRWSSWWSCSAVSARAAAAPIARSGTRGSRRRLRSTCCRCSVHQPHGGARVARSSASTIATCSSSECSAECADWYISAISEQRDSRSAQQLGQHLVAQHAREHDVEVGQQPRAARDVGALHRGLLGRAGGARSSAICAVVSSPAARRDHRRLEHAAHLEHLARLVDARLGDARAARRLERDELVAAQLVQRLAHQRARDLEDVGDLLLGELGAGHQPALDDRGGDRFDDALRSRCRWPPARRRAPTAAACAGGGMTCSFGAARGIVAAVGDAERACFAMQSVYTFARHVKPFSRAPPPSSREPDGQTHHPRARHRQRLPGRRHGGRAVPAASRRRGDARCKRSTLNARRPRRRPAARRRRVRAGPLPAGVRGRRVLPRAAARNCRSRRSSTRCRSISAWRRRPHYHVPLLPARGPIRPTAAAEAAAQWCRDRTPPGIHAYIRRNCVYSSPRVAAEPGLTRSRRSLLTEPAVVRDCSGPAGRLMH